MNLCQMKKRRRNIGSIGSVHKPGLDAHGVEQQGPKHAPDGEPPLLPGDGERRSVRGPLHLIHSAAHLAAHLYTQTGD